MDQINEQEAMGLDLPVLRGERLTLRLAGRRDADALFVHLNDWDVVRMLARVPWPVPRDNLQRFLDKTEERAMRGEAFELAILPDGREAVGVVGLEFQGGELHLGYWLGRAWWGQGVMTEAVRLVLGHVFGQNPRARVISGVFSDNPASLRVQEKLGFEVIGAHLRWCEARRAEVRHIDTSLRLEQYREDAR